MESTLRPDLSSLVLLIKGPTFYADGRLEPTIDELLANITGLPSLSTTPKLKGKPIYWLFMNEKARSVYSVA
jgi:hypothetical protein